MYLPMPLPLKEKSFAKIMDYILRQHQLTQVNPINTYPCDLYSVESAQQNALNVSPQLRAPCWSSDGLCQMQMCMSFGNLTLLMN